MAYKVKIDNVEYDLRDNFTIKEELNEKLDSANIQFNVYGQEANFESFDVLQIYDTENKISPKYFLVDSFDDEIHSFGANFARDDHLYTVSAFSETKELERITLPNCSVTQPLTGTKHSVYYEIERFCSLYVPRIKIYNANATNKYIYTSKFSLDPALRTKFINVVCPEFQWNNPTLREVLNDLMSTLDCIVVVKQGIISFYNLRQRRMPIDTSLLSSSRKSMSSQDYVGELTIDMQNAIGKTSSIVCEGVTLKAPEGEGELTTSNGVIKTLSPIYSIKRLRVKYPMWRRADPQDATDSDKQYYAWIDITDHVLEEEEFNLLSNAKIRDNHSSIYQQLPDFTDSNGHAAKKHKVNFLYFKRGSNNIYNFATPYNYKPSGGVAYDIDFGLNLVGGTCQQLYGLGSSASNTAGLIDVGYDPRNLQFYLEYETLTEHALKVGKNLPVKHPDNRIFDNQDNSYVDQEHMSIFEYAKVNRLGHKLRKITGEYHSESQIPSLGDYINDEILFSREITYQDNMLKFTGYLSPNYILKDFFTGVRAKKRSWQIAKKEDALTRHDVYKLYVETSFNEKFDSFNDSDGDILAVSGQNIVQYLIPFNITNSTPYKTLGCAVRTIAYHGIEILDYPSSNSLVFLDAETAILGRSLCVNYGFNDNYKSADYIVSDGEELVQSFYAYADNNGEYDDSFIVLHWINHVYGTNSAITQTTYEDLIAQIREGYLKPKVAYSDVVSSHYHTFTVNTKKDNREIIRHSLQFEFCSDTKDIIVTDQFLKEIIFVDQTSRTASSFKVYASEHRYPSYATEVLGNLLSDATISKTAVNQNVKVTIKSGDNNYPIPSGIRSWAITDQDDNLLLAVNIKTGQTVMECWFNLLRNRDDKIYSDTYNGIPVGDITASGIAAAPTNYAALTTLPSLNVNILGRSVVRSETISGNDEENE